MARAADPTAVPMATNALVALATNPPTLVLNDSVSVCASFNPFENWSV